MDIKRTAVITGGSRGIGRAICEKFAKEGYNIVINCSSSVQKAEELQDELKEKYGTDSIVVKANVQSNEEVKAMIDKTMESFGRVDVLVNNAGITRDGLLIRMSEDDFDEVISANLKGVFNCIKNVSRIMIKQKYGRIVNMASVAGMTGNVGQVNYSASKAGVIGLTKSVAKELGSKNITANCVAPGFIDTDMTKVVPEDVKDAWIKSIPVKRIGQGEDVANAVFFLASENSSYITGQTLPVDGGMTMY